MSFSGPGAFKGKGKGKGVPKAPPKPSPPKLSPPKAPAFKVPAVKTAAKHLQSFPPGKVHEMTLMMGCRGQEADGSCPAEAFLHWSTYYMAEGDTQRDVLQGLSGEDTAFVTAVFVYSFEKSLEESDLYEEKEVTTVTRMDDGRGQEARTETVIVKPGYEDALQHYSVMSPLGNETIAAAKAWMASNVTDEEQETLVRARAWVTEHVVVRMRGDFTGGSGTKKTVNAEELQKREELRRQKELELKEARRLVEEHWRGLTSISIAPGIPWSTCQRTRHVGGGTGGCLMVELEGDTAACLKPQKQHAVSEFMAERVMKALGVPVASCRPISALSDEYFALAESLYKAPVDGEEAEMRMVVTGGALTSGETGIEFLGALEFVQGHGLVGLEACHALAGEGRMEIYAALGGICAADAIMNNLDRMPLPIWNNDGNLNNVMVRSGREVVAIDQQVNVIIEGPGRDAYLAKLKDLVADLSAGRDSKAVPVVKQALMENAGTDAADDAMEAFVGALRQGFVHAAQLVQSGAFEEAVSQALFEAVVTFGTARTDHGQSRVEAMADFLRCTAAAVAEAVGEAMS